jgi:hypothetical protein
MDLRSKFENNEMDRNDDRIQEFEQSQKPDVRISFPEQVGGSPLAVVRRQNVPSKWIKRKFSLSRSNQRNLSGQQGWRGVG